MSDGLVRALLVGLPTPTTSTTTTRSGAARSGTSAPLFERICLEAFQSGLAWITILRKRENFRAAFAGFDPELVAQFGDDDVERLMADAGIVRNRAKIEATIANARAVLALRDAGSRSAGCCGRSHRPSRRRPRTG